MVDVQKQDGGQSRPKLVGQFIRQRRESMRLSQRALGQLFDPPVTTQFISNVERGITPLPPTHIPTLAKVLMVSDDEIKTVLEQEYAMKLSGKVSIDESLFMNGKNSNQITVETSDLSFMRALYDAYKRADTKKRNAFFTVCESILEAKLPEGLKNRDEA